MRKEVEVDLWHQGPQRKHVVCIFPLSKNPDELEVAKNSVLSKWGWNLLNNPINPEEQNVKMLKCITTSENSKAATASRHGTHCENFQRRDQGPGGAGRW